MLFNSYIFILFFLPVTWGIYFLLNSNRKYKAAQVCLIIASLIFYGYYNWYYLLVIAGSIIANYSIAALAHLLKNRFTMSLNRGGISLGKSVILLGIILNIGVLFYFKYMNFFLENVNSLFHMDFKIMQIVLPLGISFYTFQQISFLIDTYKENITYKFVDYAEFVCFFPQLVAGPIVSHDMIAQFKDEERKRINFDNISRGLFLFSTGLFKKIIIADTFAKAVDWGFSNVGAMSSLDAIIVMIAYTFQIYFDFSGYSDMAVGLAAMFNINIPCNFDAPYQADSIIDFWKRWHITLTQFLRKYIYYPLGGSKKGRERTYFNIFIVFFISGIWHGANWTFIVWGIIHGIANICNRIFAGIWSKIWEWMRWACTFIFLCFTWMIFRAESLKQVGEFLQRTFSDFTFHVTHELAGCFVLPEVNLFTYAFRVHDYNATNYVIMFLAILFAFGLVLKVKPFAQQKFQSKISNLLGTIVCLIWSVLSLAGNSIFIYFGF